MCNGSNRACRLWECGRHKGVSLLGISCSRESFYQQPLDMLNISRQICASYAGYEEVEEPAAISVQGEEWYE